MGLSDIGIKFGIGGADQSIRQLGQLRSGFSDFQRTVDSAVSRLDSRTNAIAGSVGRMSKSITSSMNLAKIAFTGFLTGKAVGGIAEWMKGSPEADVWKDYLRRNEASPDALKQYGEHVKGLRGKIPELSAADYYQGMFDIQSKMGTDAVAANQRAMESATYLSKGLGPGSSVAQSADLLRKFMWSYGIGKGTDELGGMIQQFSAQIPKAVSMSGARGHDFQVALGHVVALYSQLGRSQEDMIADIATVAGSLGERSGELLRAVMSKQGEGFGKLAGAIAKERVLQQAGVKTEFDLPQEQRELLKKSVEVTKAKAARWAGLAVTRDPAMYMGKINEFLDELTKFGRTRGMDVTGTIQEAFGETAMQGLPLLAKAYASGERQKLGKALRDVSPLEEMRKTEESYQSFTAKYGIFQQKIEDLSKTIKKPFQALGMELMKPYGESIDAIESNWNTKTEQMSQNMVGFFQSASAGFRAAFGPLPDADATLKSIAATLGDPDPEKWRQLGDEFGRWAGTNLEPLTANIASIASSISTIAGLAPSIKTLWDWTGGWAAEGYKKFGTEVLPDLVPDLTGYETGNIKPLQRARELGPAIPNTALNMGIGKWLIDGLQSLMGFGKGQAGQPQVNVESKPQINVKIGDREIKEIAVEAIKEEMKADYAAGRNGAFESWGF